MTFKKIIGKLHLWLGLTSGLIVFIISITGCIYAFQVEIQEATQSYRRVEAQEKPFLPPSALQKIAEEQLPDKKIHAVEYTDKNRAAVVSFYDFDPEYYYLVYLNPYSGEVLKVKNMDEDFFRQVLMLHYYLWLPPAIGQPIAASATLIFLVMLISGLILWWPRNKGASKQRFSIKWGAKWRRKNYDLHNVLGFYMTWIVIFITVTGLVWGFQWFAKGSYWMLSGGKTMIEYAEPPSDTTNYAIVADMPSVDKIWHKIKSEEKDAEFIEVHFPETNQSSIAVTINPEAGTYWKSDYRYFDQYSLKELEVDHLWGKFENASTTDKIFRMNYDVHVGAISGLPGKIMAFLASLVAASLPVTGFYIWWGRKNKKKKKEKEKNKKETGKVNSKVRKKEPSQVV